MEADEVLALLRRERVRQTERAHYVEADTQWPVRDVPSSIERDVDSAGVPLLGSRQWDDLIRWLECCSA